MGGGAGGLGDGDAEVLGRGLGGGLRLSEAHGLVRVVASGLVDAGGGGGAGALVDGGLHLVEEVVDVEEVALRL